MNHNPAGKWKPGQSGNPKGSITHLTPAMKKAKLLTAKEFIGTACELLHLSVREIQAIAKNKDTTAIKAILASVINTCSVSGDMYKLNVLLDRIIEKVPEKVQEDIPPMIEIVCD